MVWDQNQSAYLQGDIYMKFTLGVQHVLYYCAMKVVTLLCQAHFQEMLALKVLWVCVYLQDG